jgi:uncharacterized membrane protein
MNFREVIVYAGASILLIFGVYNLISGNASYGLLWIILGIFFLAITQSIKKPMKAAKTRKIIIILCAIILLALGGYSIYIDKIYPGFAWIIAGIIGIFIGTMINAQE